jgi:hypothetical protein
MKQMQLLLCLLIAGSSYAQSHLQLQRLAILPTTLSTRISGSSKTYLKTICIDYDRKAHPDLLYNQLAQNGRNLGVKVIGKDNKSYPASLYQLLANHSVSITSAGNGFDSVSLKIVSNKIAHVIIQPIPEAVIVSHEKADTANLDWIEIAKNFPEILHIDNHVELQRAYWETSFVLDVLKNKHLIFYTDRNMLSENSIKLVQTLAADNLIKALKYHEFLNLYFRDLVKLDENGSITEASRKIVTKQIFSEFYGLLIPNSWRITFDVSQYHRTIYIRNGRGGDTTPPKYPFRKLKEEAFSGDENSPECAAKFCLVIDPNDSLVVKAELEMECKITQDGIERTYAITFEYSSDEGLTLQADVDGRNAAANQSQKLTLIEGRKKNEKKDETCELKLPQAKVCLPLKESCISVEFCGVEKCISISDIEIDF